MEKIVKIANAPGYVRDMETGAVILNNRKHLDKYMADKRKVLEEKRRLSDLESEISSLKEELATLAIAIKALKDNNCTDKDQ